MFPKRNTPKSPRGGGSPGPPATPPVSSMGVDQQAHRESASSAQAQPPSVYPPGGSPCGHSPRDLELNETRSVLPVAGQVQSDHLLHWLELQRVHGRADSQGRQKADVQKRFASLVFSPFGDVCPRVIGLAFFDPIEFSFTAFLLVHPCLT